MINKWKQRKMKNIKFFIAKILYRFPLLKNFFKSVYELILGLPKVSDSEITDKLILECVDKPNPVILEIGCNDGSQTCWLAKMFEHGTIYCFEPEPRAIRRFKEKVGQHSNINLFEMALSDKNGELTFHQSAGHLNKKDHNNEEMPEGWDLSGSIKKPKLHLITHPSITFDQSITVKTTTLDDWCNEHSIEVIDFIWMDVQGAELDIFRGGKNALSKTRFIYTEYSNIEIYEGQATLPELLQHLKTFKIIMRYQNDVLLKNTQFE